MTIERHKNGRRKNPEATAQELAKLTSKEQARQKLQRTAHKTKAYGETFWEKEGEKASESRRKTITRKNCA